MLFLLGSLLVSVVLYAAPAVAQQPTSVAILWDKVPPQSGLTQIKYQVLRCELTPGMTDCAPRDITPGTTPPNVSTFTDTSIVPGARYQYEVQLYGTVTATGEPVKSVSSNKITFTPPALPPPIPGTPQNLRLVVPTGTAARQQTAPRLKPGPLLPPPRK